MECSVFQTIEPASRRANRASLLALIGFVGLSALVAASNGASTTGNLQNWLRALARLPSSAPGWMFGPLWPALTLILGVAAWLLWRRIEVGAHRKRAALRLWGWQLLLGAFWPSLFYGLHSPALGMTAMLALLGCILATARAFWSLHRPASLLLLPYAAWIGIATYLLFMKSGLAYSLPA